MRIATRSIVTVAALFLCAPALAQSGETNFPDRKAIILNNCPHVELSLFFFANRFADRRTRFEQNMTWKNIGTQSITAFEIVVLRYDAFDQRMIGSRWTVTGRNSGDWRPLEPGATDRDGTYGYSTEDAFTAIAYVRQARLADGTVWRANDSEIIASLRKLAPGIKDPGSLRPDPPATPAPAVK